MKWLIIVNLVLTLLLSMCMLGISCTCEKEVAEPSPPEPEEGVYLNPPSIETEPGQQLSIEIKIKLPERGVSGGEINLAFNPDIMEGVDIELGNFLGSSPIVGLNQVNNEDGVMRLALARVSKTPVPSPPGIFATANFRVQDSATSGIYELKLTKVGLADENFQDITDFPVQGASIKISP